MNSQSDLLKSIVAKAGRFMWVLGLHAFSIIIFLIFIDIICGGIIFYQYVFKADKEVPVLTGNIIKFNNTAYQDVLNKMQTNNTTLQYLMPNNIEKNIFRDTISL